jgi:hypothetical protein
MSIAKVFPIVRLFMLAANGWRWVVGRRLKQLPYPMLHRNEYTKNIQLPKSSPTETHRLLAKVLL